jgi:HAD superfamily hydrolase (TIGR01549 family)
MPMTHPSRLRQIKAISFDGDMTLWDFDKVMRHSLGFALEELRKRVPGGASARLTIDTMIEIRNGVSAELSGKLVNLEAIRLRAFERTVEFVGSDAPDLAAQLNGIYLQHRFEDVELYPDVLPAFDALGRGYALGLLSNGNGYPDRCGLQNRFAFVVFSEEVGVEKPAATIFEEACRRAGCAPQELMHVGDSLESDVQGAQRIGALAVWLNRARVPKMPETAPDFEIHSLSELASILGGRGGG